jgi:hypothetical protein
MTKTIIAAIALAALLGNSAMAYDFKQSMVDEWEQRRQLSETQRIEQAAKYRQMELNERMDRLEYQQRIDRQNDEWQQRQLEADNYRPGWR